MILFEVAYFISPTGATMEVNISHRCRQEILTTSNLADPKLFNNALNELIQLIKMVHISIAPLFNFPSTSISSHLCILSCFPLKNLAKDFWSSMFFLKLKEETSMRSNGRDLEQITGWNLSPRLSSVQGTDDPFNQEQFPKGSGHDSTHDSDP